jgi:alpha-D-xyloside xylohydrolase
MRVLKFVAVAAALCLTSRISVALPTGLNSVGQLHAAVPASAGNFTYVRLEHGMQLRVNGVVKNVLFYGPTTVRVNANSGQSFARHPSLAVIAKPASVAFEIVEAPDRLTLSSPQLRIVADKETGSLSFLRANGSLIAKERIADIERRVISDAPTYEVKQTFVLAPEESLYGLGQYDKPYMDYRGQEVLMVQTNIGIVTPMLVSTRRYGILWDSYSKSTFKDDSNGASLWSESSPAGVDYYFIGGADMDDVIAGYRDLTGAAPMFPKAAFGLFMSKERYKTQQRLVEVTRAFRKEGFPLDYIVQDWQYWGGDKDGTWSGMIWNKDRFPDPVALTRTLHDELHVKLMNSIWPSVGNDTQLARELDAKGLRFEPLHWISGQARVYDAFSAEGRAIYFKHIKKGLLDVGVDALWMDGTEVEVGGACHDPAEVEADIKRLGVNAMGDFTRYLNPYSLVTTGGVYDGQRASSNKRVFTLTRSAWAGQQRYAAVPWSGDTTASWNTFRSQISGGINVAMAGLPYWTQDTGGFFVNFPDGERNPEYRELLARWHQFAIFNPIYRIHGTSIEREPYIFKTLDPVMYQSLLRAAQLRYRLLPYIYSLAWQSTAQGYTMMRGLPMDFPDDRQVRKLDDQFTFGPAFLVHPVTRAMFHVGNPPASAIPSEALRTSRGQPGVDVEYFEGTNFERSAGKLVDPKIEYTWPGPPLANPPAGLTKLDDFSGRWQGTIIAPEDGEYELGVEGDDGFRLWLDGKQVIEDWSNNAARYRSTRLKLRKNQAVAFKLEYFQGRMQRSLRLAWRTPTEFRQLARQRAKTDDTMLTYLPEGAHWYDFWTNERFDGGQQIKRKVPLDAFPLFVRAGSIVPMGPAVQYATEQPDAPYEIRIYPGANGSFTVYEDDNETYNYERGEHATYELSWNDGSRTLTIGERKGAFPGMTRARTLNVTVVERGTANAPVGRSAIYEGRRIELNFM